MSTITLLHDHTHAGRPCAAGEQIDVDAPTAQWLADHGVAELAADNCAADPAPAQAVEPVSVIDRALHYLKPHHADQDNHGDDHER